MNLCGMSVFLVSLCMSMVTMSAATSQRKCLIVMCEMTMFDIHSLTCFAAYFTGFSGIVNSFPSLLSRRGVSPSIFTLAMMKSIVEPNTRKLTTVIQLTYEISKFNLHVDKVRGLTLV